MSTYPNLPFLMDPPTSLDWIFRFEHGHLTYSDEIIKRKLIGQLAPTTGHVAIVCVLGEQGSGKSQILDALIRRLTGQDVSVFATPSSHLDNRSCDLAIATGAILIPPTTAKDVGVLLVDVRSWMPSSPYYFKLMKLAYKLSSVKLISHYRSLSPELSQLATKEDIIHINPADVFWDGAKIYLSNDFFARVSNIIQDAGYAKHTTYFRLTKRLETVYHNEIENSEQAAEFPRQQYERVDSKTSDHSTPPFVPTFSGITAAPSSTVDFQGPSAYFPQERQLAGNKQTYSLPQNTTTCQVPAEVQSHHQEYGKEVQASQAEPMSNMATQLNAISCAEAMYQAFFQSNKLYFDKNELFLQHASVPHSTTDECSTYNQLQQFHQFLEDNYSHWYQSAHTQVNKAMEAAEADFAQCLLNQADLKLDVAFDSTIPEGFANALRGELRNCHFQEVGIVIKRWEAYIASLLKTSSDELEKQFQATVAIIDAHGSSLQQFMSNDHCLPPKKFVKVADDIYQRISEKSEIQRPALQNAIAQFIGQARRYASQENDRLFQIEYACAVQAVPHAVNKFTDILPSGLPALMTTKDQNNILSSYGAIIMKAFKSSSKGSAWKRAADKKLWPALESYMNELRQANKNIMRRWDKVLDSVLRQCGQVYHAQMQRHMPPKTKVSTADLERHHLSAIEPTLLAFCIPNEVNHPTRASWEVVLRIKLEEWKAGFVYLNDKTPEQPEKVPALRQRKEETTSVGIYFGKTSILFATGVEGGGHSATFQKQLSPYISVSQQGIQLGQDSGDFNIYDVLTEPTVPRESKKLQFGRDSQSVTQEMAAVLYMYEAKKMLDDFCGRETSYACVAIPHFISGAAKTAIKESLRMAGFANVTLIQYTAAIALNLVQKKQRAVVKGISIHHSNAIFEISNIAVETGIGLTVEKTSWSEKLTTKNVTKCLSSAFAKQSAPPQFVLLQEEEDCSANICHHIRSFDFGAPHNARQKFQPWDTTVALAKYAEQRRQQSTAVIVHHSSPYEIKTSSGKFIETQDASTWICHPKSKTDGDFLVYDGIDAESGNVEPRWSYYFQVSPPGVTGPVCRFKFETDGSLGIERLEGVSARVESKTSKFLSQWDREDLAKDVKRYLAVMCQPESTKETLDERVTEQDDTVRGQLARLIQRVKDALEDPTFAAGPDRDFLSERVQLYSEVLTNEVTRERDLDKALQKLQAVTEGFL